MEIINRGLIFLIIMMSANVVFADIASHSAQLRQQLFKAYQSQSKPYQARTQYLCENDHPCYINRLILESSPYLLQHAHNPVDWFTWGKEALDKAKIENKPIFLSIGYSACHWCHVMEKESFDNKHIASLLNNNFISIKVDRERRADIDELFGNVVTLFQGQQGWPMSLWLTPDGQPFFGGGYYTEDEFKALLNDFANDWQQHPQNTLLKAQQVMEKLQSADREKKPLQKIDDADRVRAIRRLLFYSDTDHGGFGGSEKFPREPWLYLLLDNSLGKTSKDDALKVLQLSLTKMAAGGINDQLAGGFHRYTTDPYWKRPHFEKMLYNQALLIPLYLQANRVEENPFYTRVAKQTADFILQNMQHDEGGFYSSLDADSEGEEGRFYTWSLDDWNRHLSQADQNFITELYDVDEYGETDLNKNVLYLSQSLDEYAKQKNQSLKQVQQRLDIIRVHLLNVRNQRVLPEVDKKIIMGWNGLAISALADASLYLNDARYLQAAVKASDFIWRTLRKDKLFYRVNYQSTVTQLAQLEDCAYYLQALIKLYDIERSEVNLKRAHILVNYMLDSFWDEKDGGFFNAAKDELAPLPFRTKSAFDKSLISANAVAAQMLIRLYYRLGDEKYRNKAQATLSAFASEVSELPSAYSGLLVAADELSKGEKGLPLYAATGHVRIDSTIKMLKQDRYEVAINLNIDEGWHINSSKPLDEMLIPTSVKLADSTEWTMQKLSYPDHELIRLGYSEDLLALYQQQTEIKVKLLKVNEGLNPLINISMQACNDRLCLPPEDIQLRPRVVY